MCKRLHLAAVVVMFELVSSKIVLVLLKCKLMAMSEHRQP